MQYVLGDSIGTAEIICMPHNNTGLLPREYIDIMKINVEGYELKVLMGVEKALSKGIVDRFIIEIHIDQVSSVDIVKFLNEYRYKPIAPKHFNNVKDMVYLELFK